MKPAYALIGCSASKLIGSHPAKDLYIGELFKAAKRYCESHNLPYYILSAKHHILNPDDVIKDYNSPITDLSKMERHCWGSHVSFLLLDRGLQEQPCLFLAGESYFFGLNGRLHNVERPLKGLGIGQQRKWLADNTRHSPELATV